MTDLKELLRAGDPLEHEAACASERRNFCRQRVLAAAAGSPAHGAPGWRLRAALPAAILMAMAISFIGTRVWPRFVGSVEAAVRFEVRLAENQPAPGLHAAKVTGSNRSIYLTDSAVVTNSDIASARVIPGNRPSQYWVSVEFRKSGAAKMRAATSNHVGKPVAILLDGQVVLSLVVRTPIGASAVISGNISKAQAARIANGIMIP